jgi:hypothetical protein
MGRFKALAVMLAISAGGGGNGRVGLGGAGVPGLVCVEW